MLGGQACAVFGGVGGGGVLAVGALVLVLLFEAAALPAEVAAGGALTQAIDCGRTGRALDLERRMVGAGERHPLQVMEILQGHYGKLATLD